MTGRVMKEGLVESPSELYRILVSEAKDQGMRLNLIQRIRLSLAVRKMWRAHQQTGEDCGMTIEL